MPGFIVPGAQPISEWASPIHGIIDTCVSAAEAVVTGIYGILPTTPGTTTALAQDQISRGEATPNGASYVGSEAAQLKRLGIPTVDYEGSQQIAGMQWTSLVNNALAQGIPVIAGVPDLSKLKDVQGNATGSAHVGHGFTIVGVDPSGQGYEVADPNTAGTGFVDYSAQALAAAHLSTLVIPQVSPANFVNSAASAASGQQATSNPLDISGQISNGIVAGFAGIGPSVGSGIGSGLVSGILQNFSGTTPSVNAWFQDLTIRSLLILFGILLFVLVGLWLAFGTLTSPRGQAATGLAIKAAS